MNANLNINQAIDHFNKEWNDNTCERALVSMKRTLHRRKVRKVVVSSSLAVLLLTASAFGVGFYTSQQSSAFEKVPPQRAAMASVDNSVMVLNDDSRVFPNDVASIIYVEKDTQTDVRVRMEKGGARFVISHRAPRIFTVRVEDVVVTVRGTIFRVDRLGSQVRVSVEEGLVQVTWANDSEKYLKPGEEALFPLNRNNNSASTLNSTPEDELIPQDTADGKKQHFNRADWRHFAHKGDFDVASKLIAQKETVRDTVDDLLLAADAMRLSGNPQKGLFYLGKIVTNHRRDPRSTLAEFTRGRILLSQLGRPREAAASFNHVQKMAPNSALAEDALAREVESWHRFGEQAMARDLALQYTKHYPKGRRLKSVQHFGGI